MAAVQFWAYSEGSPQGELFSAGSIGEANDKQRSLKESGYVDNPAKLGINLWGPEADQRVAKIKAEFEAGRVPAFEEMKAAEDIHMDQAEDVMAKAKAQEALRTQEDVVTETHRKLESAREEAFDKGLDPDTVAPAPPSRPVEIPETQEANQGAEESSDEEQPRTDGDEALL